MTASSADSAPQLVPGQGALVISLDYELFWGVRDVVTLEAYRANLLGVREAVVPRTLELFQTYGVRATWATVGLLFFPRREELLAALPPPDLRPAYRNPNLSPYPEISSDALGPDEAADPYRYGESLLRLVQQAPGQEIGSHTFCHYYCLEPGQTEASFRADLAAAAVAAEAFGIPRRMQSIVFPRNQLNPDYIAAVREAGFSVYRGNPRGWLYKPRNQVDESRFRRAVRLADAYLNVSGHNAYPLSEVLQPDGLADVRASRFLRPWSPRWRGLEPLRYKRILDDLSFAARSGGLYHLWWHPHNMGVNIQENLGGLERILDRFARLRDEHGMKSLHMGDVGALAKGEPDRG